MVRSKVRKMSSRRMTSLSPLISDVILGDDIFRTLERKANLIIQPWSVSSF